MDIPPNPSKNEQIITFIPRFLQAIADVTVTPLVSSKNPVNIGIIKLVFIGKDLNKEEIKKELDEILD